MRHQYVIDERDIIYLEGVDRTLEVMGLTVRRTPVRAPEANAFCERLVGTIHRECLDFVMPLSERASVGRPAHVGSAATTCGRQLIERGPFSRFVRPINEPQSRTDHTHRFAAFDHSSCTVY